VKPGDLVETIRWCICNPKWGDKDGTSWLKTGIMGLVVEEQHEWCRVKTDEHYGWISKYDLRVL